MTHWRPATLHQSVVRDMEQEESSVGREIVTSIHSHAVTREEKCFSPETQDVRCAIFHAQVFGSYSLSPYLCISSRLLVQNYLISYSPHLPFPYISMCQQHTTKIRTKPASVSSPVRLHEEVAREERVSQSVIPSPKKE